MSSTPNRFLLYKMENKDRILQEAIRVTGERNPSKLDLIRAASRCWAAEPQCKKEEWKPQRKPQRAAERSGKGDLGGSRDLHAREAGEDHELSQKERFIEVDEAYDEGEVIHLTGVGLLSGPDRSSRFLTDVERTLQSQIAWRGFCRAFADSFAQLKRGEKPSNAELSDYQDAS